ncbi:hypothetical protein Val02_00900 [Virgisporangium aliadipatigenens]|uniref:SAM-dependent methyltransferase n=1 Tax=Virgisporangium aliadipatigenens TaxID=741659 RepID=A0A8J3YDQ1_9ACTN|nr:SAM-dependent methyltransferase [Virgisporangium aliadipatigenens]GIJ43204.1 hypothetical protein Val02_00900 [Virgisporangium aliadipatigenens]
MTSPDPDHYHADLQTDRPHPARVYDYLLGGKDNFAADRAAAEQGLKVNPNARTAPRENRAYLMRTVRFLVDAGVRRFIDVGTGLPTSPNIHEIAQGLQPSTEVAYIDNDPIVLTHARALLTSTPEGRTSYVDADLSDVDRILGAEPVRHMLDSGQPVALLLYAILHFFPDATDPYGIVRRLVDALPSGSYLVISHITDDYDKPAWAKFQQIFRAQGIDTQFRSQKEVEAFFEGLQLEHPGVVPILSWRPDTPPEFTDAQVALYGGVGRKP